MCLLVSLHLFDSLGPTKHIEKMEKIKNLISMHFPENPVLKLVFVCKKQKKNKAFFV